jgi:hypothetical protein
MDDKSDIYAAVTVTWQEQDIVPNLKKIGRNSGVKQIPTNCISVSGGLPGDMRKHMLEKIIGGGQGKRKYPTRECRACNERVETC